MIPNSIGFPTSDTFSGISLVDLTSFDLQLVLTRVVIPLFFFSSSTLSSKLKLILDHFYLPRLFMSQEENQFLFNFLFTYYYRSSSFNPSPLTFFPTFLQIELICSSLEPHSRRLAVKFILKNMSSYNSSIF